MDPIYQRPTNLAPPDYREPGTAAAQPVTTGTLLADIPWWEVFLDSQLQTLIRTALENNQDLKIPSARERSLSSIKPRAANGRPRRAITVGHGVLPLLCTGICRQSKTNPPLKWT